MTEPTSRAERGPWLDAPKAILIGSAVVALGLYFGLRDRGTPPQAAPSAERSDAPAMKRTAEAPVAGSAPSAAKPDLAAAAQSARAGVEAQKKKLVTTCWEPASASAKRDAGVSYQINFTFGADGKQVARGISEPRDASRPGLVNCLQLALEPIAIPPPGEGIAIEVPLELP